MPLVILWPQSCCDVWCEGSRQVVLPRSGLRRSHESGEVVSSVPTAAARASRSHVGKGTARESLAGCTLAEASIALKILL